MMRPKLLLLLAMLCPALAAGAQTFLQSIQKKTPGQASVRVVQDKEIDDLVNYADVSGRKQEGQPSVHAAAKPSADARDSKPAVPQASHADATKRNQAPSSAKKDNDIKHPTTDTQHHAEQHHDSAAAGGIDIPTVDMRKKMPKRSYKVDGYRVQVYAGTNSRQGKEQAQKAGNAVKMAMPDQPVYVHFYSPRWICRVGNYRSYEEASRVLKQVKALGYAQACIISGKITVQY